MTADSDLWMDERPDYKNHPLWNDAMGLTREAYSISERLRQQAPETSRRLRKAAVAIPAHVASALSSAEDRRTEHMLAARGSLAELSRQLARVGLGGCEELLRRAADLDRLILFEFGAAEGIT